MSPESLHALVGRMIEIPTGSIVLRDEGTRTSWPVDIAAFLLAAHPVTRELYGAACDLTESTAGPRTPVTEVLAEHLMSEDEMPAHELPHREEPLGEQWEEATVADKYPELAAKFGSS